MPKSYVDLTHTITENSPAWNLDCGFHKEMTLDFKDCPDQTKFRIYKFSMPAGMGTHIDVPAHCFRDKRSVEQIPLKDLISPCLVIDVSREADEKYKLSVDVVKRYSIEPGTFVIVYTGWDRFWNEPQKYHNHHRFPSVSESAAEYLVEKGISGLGIDTLSPDAGDSGFPVHRIILGAGKYLVENVASAKLMPERAHVWCLPLKVKGATEAPVRLVGVLESAFAPE